MFSLRIHSVDFPDTTTTTFASVVSGLSPIPPDPSPSSPRSLDAAGPSTPTSSSHVTPNFHLTRGIIHLYRTTTSSSSFQLPPWRGTRLLVLAVPSQLFPEDFIRFCGPCVDGATDIRVIRNDGTEDRYSVLVEFDEQKSADAFYTDLNGWRFSATEGEICHVLFLVSVQYTASMGMAATQPIGSTELPTCPVCIERLDQEISGIIATTCDHSYQCSCVSMWENSSCPVCQFCQKHSEKPGCSVCGTSENLWICVICGFVGCGRYKEGHAIRHWKDSQHTFSLDLETQRVWDYFGDNYVHRLNHSKSEDKLVKSKSKCKHAHENCVNCAFNDDSDIGGVIMSSKVEAIADEYNRLLESQLETQRKYFEALLLEARKEKEKQISEAVDEAVNMKLQDIQLKIDDLTREKKKVADENDKLTRSQDILRATLAEIEERQRSALRLKDESIQDLEEQIRDFTVSIEAQKAIDKISSTDDIKGGTLMPVPLAPAGTTKSKRSSRTNKRS